MRKIRPRRRLSLTPLIDVIFLLLLFFMLSSTFSKFSEVTLNSGGAGTVAQAATTKPYFLQLGPEDLSVNGTSETMETVAAAFVELAPADTPVPVLVSLRPQVTSQRLTDLLVALRGVAGISVTVLGAA